MLKIISIIEFTTKNVRKMKYYKLVLDDGSECQLTRDQVGKYYIDGKEVVDRENIEDINNYFIQQQRAKLRR